MGAIAMSTASQAQSPRDLLLSTLWQYGAFDSPDALEVDRVKAVDLPTLQPTDKVVKAALRAYQNVMSQAFDPIALELHGRPAIRDGEFGPATERLLKVERCGHRDFPDPDAPRQALGTNGNWKGCHGIGNFHCCVVRITDNVPSHWKPIFGDILNIVTEGYRVIGCQLYWTGPGAPFDTAPEGARHQTEMQWVSFSSGWIGLATVVLGMSCNASPIFNRYLASYLSGSSRETCLAMLPTLVMHELGHNHGCEHTSGGIMNPSILRVKQSWIGDPAENFFKRQYGGEPVPSPGPGPGPGPDPLEFRFKTEVFQGDKLIGKYISIPDPSAI